MINPKRVVPPPSFTDSLSTSIILVILYKEKYGEKKSYKKVKEEPES